MWILKNRYGDTDCWLTEGIPITSNIEIHMDFEGSILKLPK